MTPQCCPSCGQALPSRSGLHFDLANGILTFRGKTSNRLPVKPSLGLDALIRCYPRPVSKEFMIEAIWGHHPPEEVEVSLRVYIRRIRRAIEPVGLHVQTYWGQGHQLQILQEIPHETPTFPARAV